MRHPMLIFLGGIPGVGKTTLACHLRSQRPGLSVVNFNSLVASELVALGLPTDYGRVPWESLCAARHAATRQLSENIGASSEALVDAHYTTYHEGAFVCEVDREFIARCQCLALLVAAPEVVLERRLTSSRRRKRDLVAIQAHLLEEYKTALAIARATGRQLYVLDTTSTVEMLATLLESCMLGAL